MTTVDKLRHDLDLAMTSSIQPGDAYALFNAALRDLALVARIKAKAILNIPTDPTIASINLPVNMVELRSIELLLTGETKPVTIEEFSNRYGFAVHGNVLEWSTDGVTPLPAGIFIVRYHRYPVDINADGDTPEIDPIGHEALVHFAARELWHADDEPALGDRQDTKYNKAKAQLEAVTSSAGTASPRMPDMRPPWARR